MPKKLLTPEQEKVLRDFAARLTEWMAAAKLTQKKLAQKAKVQERSVSDIIGVRHDPQFGTVLLLIEAAIDELDVVRFYGGPPSVADHELVRHARALVSTDDSDQINIALGAIKNALAVARPPTKERLGWRRA